MEYSCLISVTNLTKMAIHLALCSSPVIMVGITPSFYSNFRNLRLLSSPPSHLHLTLRAEIKCRMRFLTDATKFVIEDIKSLDLYVSVIWLGPNLKNVTSRLIEERKDQPIVILSWTPSIITASGEFVSVIFPPCENERRITPGCHYELQRLVKSTSRTLAQGARQAWEVSNVGSIINKLALASYV